MEPEEYDYSPGQLPEGEPDGTMEVFYTYTVVATKKYYTIPELLIQVTKAGEIRDSYQPAFSPYHHSTIFKCVETEPIKIIEAYRAFRTLQSLEKQQHANDRQALAKKAKERLAKIMRNDTFLRELARAIKRFLPSSRIQAAVFSNSFYIQGRHYNIRVSDHDHIGYQKQYEGWWNDDRFASKHNLGIVLRYEKSGIGYFLIGGEKLEISSDHIRREDIYKQVCTFLESRGVFDE